MSAKSSPIAARVFAVLLLVGLALVPPLAAWLDQPFWVTLFTRILIFALAAMGLNLVLGFGAMVSFGHAMYLGLGAYVVGILSYHGMDNGFVQLLVALALGAGVALAVGAICLRTSGMAFIMITLAFAQMLFYLSNSIKAYGGDEGLNIRTRSLIALPGLVLDALADRRDLGVHSGQIGDGIAALVRPLVALATAPWHVLAVRVTDRIGKSLARAVKGGKMDQAAMDESLARITIAEDLSEIKDADLVVEVVPEDLGLKLEVMGQIEKILAQHGIIKPDESLYDVQNLAVVHHLNAALRAIRLGYQNVHWYRGGIEAWKEAGLSLAPSQRPAQRPQ